MDGIYMGNWYGEEGALYQEIRSHVTSEVPQLTVIVDDPIHQRPQSSAPQTDSVSTTDRTRTPFTAPSCALQHHTPSKHPSTAHQASSPSHRPPKTDHPNVSPPPNPSPLPPKHPRQEAALLPAQPSPAQPPALIPSSLLASFVTPPRIKGKLRHSALHKRLRAEDRYATKQARVVSDYCSVLYIVSALRFIVSM